MRAMKETIIFKMKSTYRDDFRIKAFSFGEGEHTLAIVGPMRGDEIHQQYVCARLVSELKKLEEDNELVKGKSILVIPSCNPFSFNVKRRFWAMDNTDINRMFPGYDKGETTQRIASAIFEAIKDYKYGIQLASFYVPGDFVPHIRMLKTGYEAIDDAHLFGLPFITTHEPRPFDTALLNYNWQLWNCKAFSLYCGHTERADKATSQQSLDAMMRFMHKTSIIRRTPSYSSGYESVVLEEEDMRSIKATHAGLLQQLKVAGDVVNKDETLARIIDPYDGSVTDEVKSPIRGVIFFCTNSTVVLQNAILYKIAL